MHKPFIQYNNAVPDLKDDTGERITEGFQYPDSIDI